MRCRHVIAKSIHLTALVVGITVGYLLLTADVVRAVRTGDRGRCPEEEE